MDKVFNVTNKGEVKNMHEECCRNCKLRYDLKKSDYSKGGCEHTNPQGFICMAFADEGIAEWMYGVSEEGMCECFTPKEKKPTNIMCETCKNYKDGWCELFFVQMPNDYKCREDYNPKSDEM